MSNNEPINNKALFIPDQPRGSFTLAQAAAHLNVSEDTVENGMQHSLASFVSSDHVRYYDPVSVFAAGERIRELRRKSEAHAAQERQRVRDGWSEAVSRASLSRSRKK